ncbi:hypothetical protein [Caldimonas caldifontis]|jgi:hypothetical protein|uniref:hypothetical protein n=1 Tax=Caldimonas caldifontis TaxID=1452508 RepID=UPI0014731BF2|nr:hypothetical protein [Caldimonas caldifontis]MCZ8109895.1 hypothetical protein [Rubrivivax sp.]
MRRCLAILLLILLPTQMSWAAVADYCMHESGAGADHVGHHDHGDHRHGASASDKSKADGSASTAVDFDCGHCHGHCAGMLDFPAGLKAHAVGSAPPRLAEAPSAEHLPAQLERPQWACLA